MLVHWRVKNITRHISTLSTLIRYCLRIGRYIGGEGLRDIRTGRYGLVDIFVDILVDQSLEGVLGTCISAFKSVSHKYISDLGLTNKKLLPWQSVYLNDIGLNSEKLK